MSGAILKGTYNDFDNVRPGGSTDTLLVDDFTGNQLINAPELSFAGYARWRFLLDNYGSLTPRLDWSFKDRVFFSPENFEELSQAPLWLLNLRLGYATPDDSIEVAGWVRNLTDEVYRVARRPAGTRPGLSRSVMGGVNWNF